MKARIVANGVRIYEGSTNFSHVVGSIDSGSEINIEAEYGEWVKIADGGWVKACYTEPIDLSAGGGEKYATKAYVDERIGVIENGAY